jgi:hypothetical protein
VDNNCAGLVVSALDEVAGVGHLEVVEELEEESCGRPTPGLFVG